MNLAQRFTRRLTRRACLVLALAAGSQAVLAQSTPAVNGVLTYGAGARYETVVHEPQLIGTLTAPGKEPFLVFSGL